MSLVRLAQLVFNKGAGADGGPEGHLVFLFRTLGLLICGTRLRKKGSAMFLEDGYESFLDQENSKKNLTKPNVQMVDKPKSSANVKKARKQTAGHCFTPA